MSVIGFPWFRQVTESTDVRDTVLHHTYRQYPLLVPTPIPDLTWKCGICGTKVTAPGPKQSLVARVARKALSRFIAPNSWPILAPWMPLVNTEFTSLCADCLDESVRSLTVHVTDLETELRRCRTALQVHEQENGVSDDPALEKRYRDSQEEFEIRKKQALDDLRLRRIHLLHGRLIDARSNGNEAVEPLLKELCAFPGKGKIRREMTALCEHLRATTNDEDYACFASTLARMVVNSLPENAFMRALAEPEVVVTTEDEKSCERQYNEYIQRRKEYHKQIKTVYIPVIFDRVFVNGAEIDLNGGVELCVVEIPLQRDHPAALRWKAATQRIPGLNKCRKISE